MVDSPFLLTLFWQAPILYALLLFLSCTSTFVWVYSLLTWNQRTIVPLPLLKKMEQAIRTQEFVEVAQMCQHEASFAARIVAVGLQARPLGSEAIHRAMESEGQRLSQLLQHRLNWLGDIAQLAPMLGLLGTVSGMFVSFYNRTGSKEHLIAIFDGLGLAVGTTIAGLVVAILAICFQAILKARAAALLNRLEREMLHISTLLAHKSR